MRRTGVVPVSIHNHVALETKLCLVRQHLCKYCERDEFREDIQDDLYLVLASGACPKVLAPHTTHVAQFRVWNFNTD
jgi:hypothetical protein